VACCCFRISFFSFFPPTNPVFFWLISKDEFACLIVVCYYLSTAVGSLSSSHESRYMRFRRSESALSSMGRGRIEIKRIENNTSRGRSPSASVATGFSRRLTSSQSSATLRWRSSSSPAGAASTSTQTTGHRDAHGFVVTNKGALIVSASSQHPFTSHQASFGESN